jgi:hypothetical protein
LLETQGYRTRVMEFISDAHTHRNVMITGVFDPALRDRDTRRSEAVALMQRYGIDAQQFETLLVGDGRLTGRS